MIILGHFVLWAWAFMVHSEAVKIRVEPQTVSLQNRIFQTPFRVWRNLKLASVLLSSWGGGGGGRIRREEEKGGGGVLNILRFSLKMREPAVSPILVFFHSKGFTLFISFSLSHPPSLSFYLYLLVFFIGTRIYSCGEMTVTLCSRIFFN